MIFNNDNSMTNSDELIINSYLHIKFMPDNSGDYFFLICDGGMLDS